MPFESRGFHPLSIDALPSKSFDSFSWFDTGSPRHPTIRPRCELLVACKFEDRRKHALSSKLRRRFLGTNLLFYSSVIIPSMGSQPALARSRPQARKSYVTDDHSSIEYSWSWDGRAGKTAKIRFTIEPIGADSGSPADLYNQSMARMLLQNLRNESSNINLTMYDHFEKELLSYVTRTASVDARAPLKSHRSSIFVAPNSKMRAPLSRRNLCQ